MNYEVMRIQAQVVCIIMTAVLYTYVKKNKREGDKSIHGFMYLLICLSAAAGSVSGNVLSDAVYFIATGFAGVLWFLFCGTEIGFIKGKKTGAVIVIHIFITAVLTYLFAGSRINSAFMRLDILYVTVVVIMTFIKNTRLFSKDEKMWNVMIAFSGIPVIFGHITEIVFPDALTVVPFFRFLSMFMIFANGQYKKTVTDNLTKLQNRYGIEEELREQLEQYEKDANDSFYVISCDLDDFKSINDRWGHIEGDRALMLIADALKKVVSEYDAVVFRIGGDEFVIITDKSDIRLAERISRDIEKEVEKIKFRDDYDIKISTGISVYDGKSDIKDILNKADKGMYEEKRKKKEEV